MALSVIFSIFATYVIYIICDIQNWTQQYCENIYWKDLWNII